MKHTLGILFFTVFLTMVALATSPRIDNTVVENLKENLKTINTNVLVLPKHDIVPDFYNFNERIF